MGEGRVVSEAARKGACVGEESQDGVLSSKPRGKRYTKEFVGEAVMYKGWGASGPHSLL